MRLGGHVPPHNGDPETWVRLHREAGYSAAYSPFRAKDNPSDEQIAAFREAAEKAGLVIAEVGAWSNPIHPEEAKAEAAIEGCIANLGLAEKIGARCCVNITGSRNPEAWDGPHLDNFSQDTFDRIVEVTRRIVDAVKPHQTCYTLETMPWIFPASPNDYLALLKAIDRPTVAVHLDPINMINSPVRYCKNGEFIRESFAKLGPFIRSCHAKDIIIQKKLTVHLDECRPGTGALDFDAYLQELAKLHPDTPLMIEHIPLEEFPEATRHIKAVAERNGLAFKELG